MKNIGILLLLFVIACKQKSKDKSPKAEPFFPVLSYIKSQVAHVDTSLYSIIKVTWLDSVKTDTAYIKREDFKGLAKDFLELPDLSDKKYKDLYTEEKFYDEGLNKVMLTYLPKNSDTTIIQRQEVLINRQDDGDKVNSFIIDMSLTNKDSSVEKKLLWQVDRSFNVVTIVQKPGQPEVTNRFKVTWE
jgi:hypothetical protein